MEACRQGDHAAMEQLYRQYSSRVFSAVFRIAGYDDAEEIVQEVFIRVYRGIGKFRGESGLGTWIYRLAVNASLTHVTRRRRRTDRIRSAAHLEEMPDSPPIGGGALDRISLERALGELPPGYRAVLVLHDVEGLSHEEIAVIMGWHRGTSKSQLHKARARMRRLLAGEGQRNG